MNDITYWKTLAGDRLKVIQRLKDRVARQEDTINDLRILLRDAEYEIDELLMRIDS